MFELGASLTAARESQRLSLADAEKLTCLRARYLAALEADRFDELPGHVYARAFLRTYADALGLDADKFVNEFTARYPEPDDDLVVVLPRVRRRFPIRFALIAAGVAGLIAAIAWSGSSQSRHPPAPGAQPAAKAVPRHIHTHVLAVKHRKAPVKPHPLLIHAVGGDCWLLVRRGGASGPVLYEGFLQPGQTLRFGPRVWVRLGAPWHVVVRRGAQTFSSRSRAPQNLVA